jgi:hypothetical protein
MQFQAWDELHRAYFNGEALWTYLTAPFLLARDDLKYGPKHIFVASAAVTLGFLITKHITKIQLVYYLCAGEL